MFSKQFMLLFFIALLQSAHAESRLTAKPMQCVTVKQGNECVAEVTLNWQTTLTGELCLIIKGHETVPLTCWENQPDGAWLWSFKSATNQTVQLLSMSAGKVIAEAEVEVGWLYKKQPPRSVWRLF